MGKTAGELLRQALAEEHPLQIVGVVNALIALLAQSAGFRALYLSGACVANSCYGLADLGLTTLSEVTEEVRRITACVELPLLVDIDTGWGSSLMVCRAIREIERAGAAAVHIEDQIFHKRCGHRSGKAVVSQEVMVDRIKAAVDSRNSSSFLIMARTDAVAIEGLECALARAQAYAEAGADLLFPEALFSLEQYRICKQSSGLPVLANITEFGKTPLFTKEELHAFDIDMALYPLSAFRAMNYAAKTALQTIRDEGSQKSFLSQMQTREELYALLNYSQLEEKINNIQKM